MSIRQSRHNIPHETGKCQKQGTMVRTETGLMMVPCFRHTIVPIVPKFIPERTQRLGLEEIPLENFCPTMEKPKISA